MGPRHHLLRRLRHLPAADRGSRDPGRRARAPLSDAGGPRPFYEEFGWAYDLLIDDPAEPWADVVEEALAARGRPSPAEILDAGCGTGRHAAALAGRGHRMTMVDASEALLEQARRRRPSARAVRARLEDLELAEAFDAVVCRGVLNDIVEDRARGRVFERFAAHLRPGGIVVLDIRDPGETARRYEGGRNVSIELDTPAGTLLYESRGRMDGDLIRVDERHELRGPDGVRVAEHELVMRPWSEEELRERLGAAGFEAIELRSGAASREDDRLLCVASSPG